MMTGVDVPSPGDELADYLRRTDDLGVGHAARLVSEVLAYFSETTEEFVRRRHRELQDMGLNNPQIFERIGTELPEWRVTPPRLTARQLRRLVYG
jgi:hypothetical protein